MFILYNKWTKLLILIISFQQLLVAGGTYFLGEITKEYPVIGLQLNTTFLLFICIFLPGTVVHYGLVWCTTRAYKKAQLEYLNTYIETNYNHPTHWRNEESKHRRHHMMCRGGQDAIHSAILFLEDALATGLNIILNTLSIILVTDLALGCIILFGGLSGLLVVHFSGVQIADRARDEMLEENHLNAHLNRSWDNIILGNQLFFNRWKDRFEQLFKNSEHASLRTVKTKEGMITLAGLLTNGIVLGGALSLAWIYRGIPGFVLAILVMVPRSLQIVMHIQIVQTYVAQWKNLKEKLAVAYECLEKPHPLDLSSFINKDNVLVRIGQQWIRCEEMEDVLKKYSCGRFTITGPNGAGKSSLLLELKKKFSEATYLPAQHQLVLAEDKLSLSTGETALSAFKDLQLEKSNILLLDEWDANLSHENRHELDKVIDKLSQERIVIEIRHSIECV